jgi:hypothetical protein
LWLRPSRGRKGLWPRTQGTSRLFFALFQFGNGSRGGSTAFGRILAGSCRLCNRCRPRRRENSQETQGRRDLCEAHCSCRLCGSLWRYVFLKDRGRKAPFRYVATAYAPHFRTGANLALLVFIFICFRYNLVTRQSRRSRSRSVGNSLGVCISESLSPA